MDEEVDLRVPYDGYYIPEGRRKPRQATFWSTLPVRVPRVDAADIRPAYRIAPPEDGPQSRPYVVGSFRNSLWWPVTIGGVPVTPGDFGKRASDGDMAIVAMLGANDARN